MLGRMLSGRPQGQATTTTKQSAEPLAMEARHVAEQLSNALNRTDAPFALDVQHTTTTAVATHAGSSSSSRDSSS